MSVWDAFIKALSAYAGAPPADSKPVPNPMQPVPVAAVGDALPVQNMNIVPAVPARPVVVIHDDTERFNRVMVTIFEHEGGYVNNPKDPGGCTKYGITLATLRGWMRQPNLTCLDVQTMHKETANSIYRAHYWNGLRAADMPEGVDLAVMDFAVNSGRQRAVQFLQRIVGVKDDGIVGPMTLRALHEQEPADVVEALCEARLRFLQGLNTWPAFGRGWSTRVAKTERLALLMAAEAHG